MNLERQVRVEAEDRGPDTELLKTGEPGVSIQIILLTPVSHLLQLIKTEF